MDGGNLAPACIPHTISFPGIAARLRAALGPCSGTFRNMVHHEPDSFVSVGASIAGDTSSFIAVRGELILRCPLTRTAHWPSRPSKMDPGVSEHHRTLELQSPAKDFSTKMHWPFRTILNRPGFLSRVFQHCSEESHYPTPFAIKL